MISKIFSIKKKIKWSWKIELILVFLTLVSFSLLLFYEINKEKQAVFAFPDTLTIRPTATSTTGISATGPTTSMAHWAMVDETPSDDDGSYVENQAKGTTQYDLYQMADHTTETTAINSVTVWVNARESNSKAGPTVKTVIKTKGTEYRGATTTLVEDAAYATTSTIYTTNPSTTQAWTWTEIDELEAGVELFDPDVANAFSRATQVWVDVDYVTNQTPSAGTPSLNAGNNISLNENTTTTVNCTSTLSDPDGGDNIDYASSTIYRSGKGYQCTNDDNNCYQIATSSCQLGTPYETTKVDATCTADVWFIADPTDAGTFSSDIWSCRITVTDNGDLTDSATNTTQTVEMETKYYLIVDGALGYGTLSPGATSSISTITGATTTGNSAIDIQLSGVAMTSTSTASTIAPHYQEYATSSVPYGDAAATDLATSTASFEVDMPKPTTHSPSTSTDDIYWRIEIPAGQPLAYYTGTTTVDAITD